MCIYICIYIFVYVEFAYASMHIYVRTRICVSTQQFMFEHTYKFVHVYTPHTAVYVHIRLDFWIL